MYATVTIMAKPRLVHCTEATVTLVPIWKRGIPKRGMGNKAFQNASYWNASFQR